MKNRHFYHVSVRAALLWLFLYFIPSSSCSQVTNISGVVNSYYNVLEVFPLRNCVRVSSIAGLSSSSKVMFIQMKGASINTSNASSSSWGDTTSLNNAGNYEIAYICSIVLDSVFFVHAMINSYTPATGKVQLVTIPRYQNATVTDTLKAKPWSNATGTGGVIAIDVIDTLVLNAPIFADSSGYRGGAFFQHSGACDFFNPAGSAYAYDADNFGTSANGAHKGEGVADYAATVDGAKGPPANAGGGGNNHNNSGGGGANLNTGGRGGGNSSSGPASCITANNMGLGGRALSSWGGKKIFPGGGGGAGHNNNAVFTWGGANGGGIIFIQADTLISNGRKISANGGNAGNSQGDGAGGGGGGGTIILDVNSFLDAATLQANGGNGGNSNDVGTPSRCFGGGGGGGGGVIYLKGLTPSGTVTTTAGTGGTEINRDAGCLAAIPGLAGSNGQIINNYSYRTGSTLMGSCGLLLPAKLVEFNASLVQNKVELNWKVVHPELVSNFILERMDVNNVWRAIQTIHASANDEFYFSIDPTPSAGSNFYRLKVNELDGRSSYSVTRYIYSGKNELISLYPNPSPGNVIIKGYIGENSIVRILDLSGRLIFQQKISPLQRELTLSPSLARGVYLVQVNQTTHKLILY